jgi:membrane-associated phospholipid phosphatase
VNALMTVLLLAAAPGDGGANVSPPPPVLRPDAVLVPPPEPPPPREVYKLHLAVDIPVTLVGASLGLGRELFKDRLTRTCPCDPASVNSLDRFATKNHNGAAGIAADVTVYGTMLALPLVDLLDVGAGRAFGEDLVVYLETLAVDTGIQNAVNFIVARPRPRTYAGDPAFLNSGEGYLSFYAGHVSTAFAGLTAAAYTARKRYGEKVWPWIVAGLIGSSVAFERVASGHHFPTDVGAAAVAGTAVGITIPWLHLRRGETRVQIARVGPNGLGLVGAF